MRRVLDRVAHAAESSVPVLVVGETGTGKDFIARAIHARGPRASEPFVIVRCGSLDDAAIEAELFGSGAHGAKQNAFERALGGVLLLDEVASLSAGLQIKLLSILQRMSPPFRLASDGKDVRIIATATVPTSRRLDAGRLRPALRQHLGGVLIELPPLRQRREDILPLANLFLERASKRGKLTLSRAAVASLQAQEWQGNVRQLEEEMSSAADGARDGEVSLDALSPRLPSEPNTDLASLSYREMLTVTRDRSTREYLSSLLTKFDGNVPQAALHAGVERESFYRLLKRYGIHATTFRSDPPSAIVRKASDLGLSGPERVVLFARHGNEA